MNNVEKKFDQMGARAKVSAPAPNRWRPPTSTSLTVDIGRDRHGPFFDIRAGDGVELSVLDVQKKDRHLVLMARTPGDRTHDPDNKSKFLCGHDERDWFVAAVPESASVSSVNTAKQALKPREVLQAESGRKIKRRKRGRRKNEARIRQGEWFFIPASIKPKKQLIITNEPLQRGGGKPHMADELYRQGGTTVYVSVKYPNGLTESAYKRLSEEERKGQRWQTMRRDARVYVRGRIRHSDHKTITLDGWHLVVPNTETQSRAMRNVAFLD